MKNTPLVASVIVMLLAVGNPVRAAEANRPLSHETLWLFKQVGAPAPSPDGRWVVVPVTEPAYDEKDESADLWIVPGDGSAAPRRLTTAKGKESNPAWSPDGAQLAFSAKRDGDEVTQIYLIDVQGGEARRLTQLALGARAPQWSPDGRTLLFQAEVSHEKPAFSPDGKRLCFTTTAGTGNYYALSRLASAAWPWHESVSPITPAFDRSVSDFAFSPDSQTVYFSAEDAGRIRVWSAPASGGEARPAFDAPQGVWLSLSLPEKAATPLLFASWEAAHSPAETHRVDLASGQRTRLTAFNVEAAAAVDWLPLREFWFTNKLGRSIHSFLALPPGFDEARQYPLLVLIHGGHASMWRDSLTRRWNYHLLAQPGYVVLLTDYVGSTGYGERFTRDILGDPLRGPAEDINAAADEALRRFAFIDGSRQAAGGASYGGHLANWLEATTTRYRCLISHAGLSSLYSQWATSDAIYHRELMMGGPFWENVPAWLEQSPSTHAKDFKTPMLLSVGENDFRVPLNNVMEMWSLLQRQRVPGRLLVWPDENHWIAKGENSRVFYREVHAWLAQWLGRESR